MTKLRRVNSAEYCNVSMSTVLDVAKALCLACKMKKRKRCSSLLHLKHSYSGEEDSIGSTPTKMEGSSTLPLGRGHSRSASATSANSLGGAGASRSISMNSISSDGSSESPLVEQEDIIELTHDVRSFKEALGRLRRIFHPDRDKQETMRVSAHERLGEVLRILKGILEKYPPIQSTELLMTAGTLIQQVKGYNYENDKADPTEFFDAIDQLALAFSSRVSEYLMGDLDNTSQPVPKTRSCDNLLSPDGESDPFAKDKGFASAILTPQEIDARLMRLGDGVELALRRAKAWSKYAKDVINYIDKRANLEAEHSRNLIKLAQTMKQTLKEESFLPFQSIYCTALDQDTENAHTNLATCGLLQGHKFMEPLTARRNEHEKTRKQIKESWEREVKKMHEALGNLRKAKTLYHQRQQEYEKAKESLQKTEVNEGVESSKAEKKKKIEDDAFQKAIEAETTYKACVAEANERQQSLEKVKEEVLVRVRELMLQCDQTMKAVTVGYFQLQHTISAPAPVQFQTLCESSRLYEPGMQYMEFVKRLPQASSSGANGMVPFMFEPYSADCRLEKDCRSNGSVDSCDDNLTSLEPRVPDSKDKSRLSQPAKAWNSVVQAVLNSDSDSVSSCHSNKSQDVSPVTSPRIPARRMITMSSGDELETDNSTLDAFVQRNRPCTSKAAETHSFRKLKTSSRCRECDSYVYFQGFECSECGLASHKKCLETLTIQCGRKPLPRKMNTFGVELTQRDSIPVIVTKCITEIERRGLSIKGIYRVSGVKSKVEKLCQSFESGAELVDLSDVHPNVIANVLKLYLRQLPEPLLIHRLYPDFVKVVKDFPPHREDISSSENSVVEELQRLVQNLPPVHHTTLAFLMHHLHRVTKYSNHNNMPPSNLGIVFGPTLLRTSEGSASLSSLVDTVHQTRVIELLITYAHEIFGPPPVGDLAEEEEEECAELEKIQEKSFLPHLQGEKLIFNRTFSGLGDGTDLHTLDSSGELGDGDDYPLPGFLATDKTQETDPFHHGSDATHSSDDWMGSSIMSDDENLEISLPDDSISKKSPLLPRSLFRSSRVTERSSQQHHQAQIKVQESRASLSSSPAVSEASQSSCHFRTTDEESLHSSDIFGRDGTAQPPVPPPRKNAPHSLLLNQSFLHGDERKHKTPSSSVSESSGVSSAASVSPTSETSQLGSSTLDQGTVYTSTAIVTLAGQKVFMSPVGARVASLTAELRRQFFETPPLSFDSNVLSSSAVSSDTIQATKLSTESSASVPSSSQSSPKRSSTSEEPCFSIGAKETKSECDLLDSKFLTESDLIGYPETVPLQSTLTEHKTSFAPRYISPLSLRNWGSNFKSSAGSNVPEKETGRKLSATRSELGESTVVEETSRLHPNTSDSQMDDVDAQIPCDSTVSKSQASSSIKNILGTEQNPSPLQQFQRFTSNSSGTESFHSDTALAKRETLQSKSSLSTTCDYTSSSSEAYSSSSSEAHSSSVKKTAESKVVSSSSVTSENVQHMERNTKGSEKLSQNRQPRFV